ncbi:MAG: 30S ribosomal protein S4 [Opitutales bacterium]|nr:30S ribosomal protein S4 [Opitutales bacterium]MCH8539872.1 30S ribosomal protein S4 [Opitutales bacterium]
MARYTGPTTRLSRRFGQPIFGANKSFEKKNYPPGIHGPRRRRKMSEYAVGLNEKQKLRFAYGLTEKQFRRTFEQAKRERGVTGERFLELLERRLDNVIYLLGFARSRKAARQFVNHGHIKVNGQKVDIASFVVSEGDEIEVRDNTSSRQLATRCLEETRMRVVPAWLTVQEDALKGSVTRLPTREEIEPIVNEQLIVEFYSR